MIYLNPNVDLYLCIASALIGCLVGFLSCHWIHKRLLKQTRENRDFWRSAYIDASSTVHPAIEQETKPKTPNNWKVEQ